MASSGCVPGRTCHLARVTDVWPFTRGASAFVGGWSSVYDILTLLADAKFEEAATFPL